MVLAADVVAPLNITHGGARMFPGAIQLLPLMLVLPSLLWLLLLLQSLALRLLLNLWLLLLL